jgi:hypothetical protein
MHIKNNKSNHPIHSPFPGKHDQMPKTLIDFSNGIKERRHGSR